jgi:hypothetical protein
MKTRTRTGRAIAFALVLTGGPLLAADFQAGVARVKITPPQPFWMSGYAARIHPSEGDQTCGPRRSRCRTTAPPGVLVTTDLIGPRAPSAKWRSGSARGSAEFVAVLNSSHPPGRR